MHDGLMDRRGVHDGLMDGLIWDQHHFVKETRKPSNVGVQLFFSSIIYALLHFFLFIYIKKIRTIIVDLSHH